MNKIFYIFLAVLLASSCTNNDDELEQNIFLIKSKVDITSIKSKGSEEIGFETVSKNINFKKGFWKLLFQKYPQTTSIIFSKDTLSGWESSQTLEHSADTKSEALKSYKIRVLDSALIAKINKLLPQTAYQNERNINGAPKVTAPDNHILNTSKISGYLIFKNIFSDTDFNKVEIYLDRKTFDDIYINKY